MADERALNVSMNKYYKGLTTLKRCDVPVRIQSAEHDERGLRKRWRSDCRPYLGSNEAPHAVSAVESAGRWLLVQGSLRNYVRGDGGGDQVFDVTYETAKGRFLNLRVNAPY